MNWLENYENNNSTNSQVPIATNQNQKNYDILQQQTNQNQKNYDILQHQTNQNEEN